MSLAAVQEFCNFVANALNPEARSRIRLIIIRLLEIDRRFRVAYVRYRGDNGQFLRD
jgi:hypothetical protein